MHLLFPSVLCTTADTGIHLTFDDGPHPIATPAVLDILKTRNIRATFFLLGRHVQQYPEVAKQIVAEGHQIGNHSFSHSNLFFKNEDFIRNEITQTENLFESVLGKRSQFFRPPYGFFNLTVLNILKELRSTCVLWSIDSRDFKKTPPLAIERMVIRQASIGSILLFHDNRYTDLKIFSYLPQTLDTLIGQGFTFKELPL